MEFTIHFRGVAVFATSGDHVTEVFFPNAETSLPPDGKKETIRNKKDEPIAEMMFHADGSPAPKHYAGALIVGSGGDRTYRKLLDRHVNFGEGDGAKVKGALRTQLPPLSDAIAKDKYEIRLLDAGERSDATRVATRITLAGGCISADQQSTLLWEIPGKSGLHVPPSRFFVGATLRIKSDAPIEIEVTDLSGKKDPDGPIKLNANQRMFFYNFDSGLPTEADLTKPDHKSDFEVDHDFKWVYQVFNRVSPDLDTWGKWLDDDKLFPAPTLAQKRLIPVSTCFATIWPDQ
ncbi:MAG TPA: hypothetical protein VM076_09705 [Gemmatimonadaceae bacterium]|nr:hypothetical protein [Gemmatimonadaceae bacterium]